MAPALRLRFRFAAVYKNRVISREGAEMEAIDIVNRLGLPLALGVFCAFDPAAAGLARLFAGSKARLSAPRKTVQIGAFLAVRCGYLGLFGLAGGALGALLDGWRPAAWAAVGAAFLVLAAAAASGRDGAVKKPLGPRVARLGMILHKGAGGSAVVGTQFAVNVPVNATPFVLGLAAMAAAAGGAGAGFVSLALFALGMSVPMLAGAGRLDRLALSVPRFAFAALAALGVWSLSNAFF